MFAVNAEGKFRMEAEGKSVHANAMQSTPTKEVVVYVANVLRKSEKSPTDKSSGKSGNDEFERQWRKEE